jgi:hypothetical protein
MSLVFIELNRGCVASDMVYVCVCCGVLVLQSGGSMLIKGFKY